ncbi:MAG: recombinase family protein [Planctomycetaceae bacterium]
MSRKPIQTPGATQIRCAIYTRKSTEEGLEQEFNTLDAQRDAGEAYIKSQQQEGWTCLPDRYDDGGFTGANMDRPALRRLIEDIESGKVDCVVVYKVDRLSRSLLDFARIMETFDRRKVSFVSVTQAFNTASSMGRLILNVLLSFAQFEREMISERTRDKIAATRRKGKWSGGMPVLGYSVQDTKLVVDEFEAERVRDIFELYLQRKSLLDVANELRDRDWRTKRWRTKKEIERGGRPFDKMSLYQVLTNVTYIGKVRYKDETHQGEHAAIVDGEVFVAVQRQLEKNGQSGGRGVRNKHNALLRGLLRCEACGCGMSHSYSKKGSRLYRYYVCHHAQKNGWDKCPSPSLPAGEIEQFVVDQVKRIGKDPALIRETVAESWRQTDLGVKRLTSQKAALVRGLGAECAELDKLAADDVHAARVNDAQHRIRVTENRIAQIDGEIEALKRTAIEDAEIRETLVNFDDLWREIPPREQSRVIELLMDKISYDGHAGKLSISYRPNGIQSLVGGRVEDAA